MPDPAGRPIGSCAKLVLWREVRMQVRFHVKLLRNQKSRRGGWRGEGWLGGDLTPEFWALSRSTGVIACWSWRTARFGGQYCNLESGVECGKKYGDSLASIFTPSARNRWLHPHHSQSIKQRLAAFALTAIVSGLEFIGFVVVPVQFGSSLGFCFVCSP